MQEIAGLGTLHQWRILCWDHLNHGDFRASLAEGHQSHGNFYELVLAMEHAGSLFWSRSGVFIWQLWTPGEQVLSKTLWGSPIPLWMDFIHPLCGISSNWLSKGIPMHTHSMCHGSHVVTQSASAWFNHIDLMELTDPVSLDLQISSVIDVEADANLSCRRVHHKEWMKTTNYHHSSLKKNSFWRPIFFLTKTTLKTWSQSHGNLKKKQMQVRSNHGKCLE